MYSFQHSYQLLVSVQSQENILKRVKLVYRFCMECVLSKAREESLQRDRLLVCIRGWHPHSTPSFTCSELEKLAMNCRQRMNNIQMCGMPVVNTCLALLKYWPVENKFVFICPSCKYLSGWELAYKRMPASESAACASSFLAPKIRHFEQVPPFLMSQFPGILNRAQRATGKIGSKHVPGSLNHPGDLEMLL